MKLKYYLNLLIIIILALFMQNCNKDNPPVVVKAKLEVFVQKDSETGPFMPDITVELFKSINDQNAGTVYKSAKTPTTGFDANGALFEELDVQLYYIKISFSDSGKVYEGFDEISVIANAKSSITVVAISLGSFQVFVREGVKNGPFIGDAKVELFLTEEDRTNGNPLSVQFTPSVDFDKNGAMFENLPNQKYYLKASYNNAQGFWLGIADGIPEKGKTINKHIVCIL